MFAKLYVFYTILKIYSPAFIYGTTYKYVSLFGETVTICVLNNNIDP